MNKRNIIIVLILIEAITLFLTIKSYSNKVVKSNNNTSLAEVHRKQFSIYTNTTGSYTEWSNNTFPTEGYILNLTESYCEDNNGTRVSNVLSYSNNKVTVTSNKTLFCTLYFDAITVDIVVNNPVSVLQNNYNVNASCDNGTATWDKMHSRLMFDTVTSVTDTCTLSAGSTPTNLGRLIDIVEDSTKLVNVGQTGVVHEINDAPDYSNVTKLAQADYENLRMYYTDGSSASYSYYSALPTYSGSTQYTSANTPFAFQSDNTWTLTPDTASRYNHFYFSPKDSGYYQLCYTLGAGATTNVLRVYKGTSSLTIKTSSTGTGSSLSAKTSGPKGEYCTELHYLNSSDYIHLSLRAMTSMSTLNFSLQKASTFSSDSGYRYEGSEPNNYVWFNDEIWRIIGSIPTKVDVINGGTTTQEIQKRIKIIRNDSIGGLARNSTNNSSWTTSTPLYMLLNGCYYGKRNMSDSYRNPDTGVDSGTVCSTYCIGYSTSQKGHCNYSENGINPSGRYANMIENVYWNVGASTNSGATASVIYENETAAQTIKGRIGLMSASDYGFATSQSHGLALDSQSGTDYTNKYTNDWLYKDGYEWTITPYTNSSYALYVADYGLVSYSYVYGGNAVRPVLYLSPSVNVVSGDGSIESPYQIAMN